MDEIKQKGLIIAATLGYDGDKKNVWAKGFAHGYTVGGGWGRGQAGDEMIRKMLAHGYSIEHISEITGVFDLYIESLQREEEGENG